ncbi:hypothetical protein HOLleu_37484 [Holothuria leucospilota]|uniref:Uncharacterized protein n=1 Tax=Holothuria leucospilota TaxID=206669 RepID=A0A9Q0YH70_HOLLE|nr:hypothetical protein HOLleu_37484 [Holothuria leucospilota]
MRFATLKRMGCDDPKGDSSASTSHSPQNAEIIAWRAALRESKFLASPVQDCIMESVSGEALDDQLSNFTDTAWTRRYHYSVYFEGATNANLPDPVFLTPEERLAFHDIKNQTKEVIGNRIREMIGQLQDEDVKLDFLELWASLQRKKKTISCSMKG